MKTTEDRVRPMGGKDQTGVKLEDFDILKVIDKGSFGKVFLVELRSNGHLYAMKRIRKDILIEKGQIDNTFNERDILLKTEHPFLLGMDYVF
jgi:serine/threonine protein kinase